MNKRLRSLAPLQFGIVVGACYAALTLVFSPFILLFALFAPFPNQHGGSSFGIVFGIILAIMIPVIYGVLGLIIGVIGAAIYNLIAKWTGGIEFSVTDAPGTPPPLVA